MREAEIRPPLTFAHFPGSGPAGEPTGPTRGSRSFRVSLNRTLHDSCLRARAGPRHNAVGVMLLPLPWAVAACGSSWQVPAVPAPWVLSPVGAPAASTAGAGHWVPRCVPSPVPAPSCGDMQRSPAYGGKAKRAPSGDPCAGPEPALGERPVHPDTGLGSLCW